MRTFICQQNTANACSVLRRTRTSCAARIWVCIERWTFVRKSRHGHDVVPHKPLCAAALRQVQASDEQFEIFELTLHAECFSVHWQRRASGPIAPPWDKGRVSGLIEPADACKLVYSLVIRAGAGNSSQRVCSPSRTVIAYPKYPL